jgi:hypothetical protein
MHRDTYGLFFTDRWVVARWDDPPAGATWATKYQGPSEKAAWTVAEIWNERRRKGLEQQARVRARQRKQPSVKFRRENLPQPIEPSRQQGSLPLRGPMRGLPDAERVPQGLIIPGIGPSRHGGPLVVTAAAPDRPAGAPDAGALAYAGPPPTPRLSAAFAAAQAEFPPLTFDSHAAVGGGRQYPYASLQKLLECVRPKLNKHGIGLRQSLTVDEGWVHCTTILSLAEEQWSETFSMPAKSSNPHDIGSAATYAKRYSLSSICAVAGEADDDGHRAEEATAERGTDPPRTPRRKAATSEHAPDPAAAAAPPLAASGSGTERHIGTVNSIEVGQTKAGKDWWKFKLYRKGEEEMVFGTFDAKVAAKLIENDVAEVEWRWDKTGKYRNALAVEFVPF